MLYDKISLRFTHRNDNVLSHYGLIFRLWPLAKEYALYRYVKVKWVLKIDANKTNVLCVFAEISCHGLIMAKNRNQDIIDAAAHLIALKGFEGLRTREIAETVGINHATIHYHFRDKETLIEAVVLDVIEKIYQSDIATTFSEDTFVRVKLRTYFHNNLNQRRTNPERFAVMQELGMRANR